MEKQDKDMKDQTIITEFDWGFFQLEYEVFESKGYLCTTSKERTHSMTYNGRDESITCGCGVGPKCHHKRQFKLSFPHLF